jgi:hypothetical protein
MARVNGDCCRRGLLLLQREEAFDEPEPAPDVTPE